MSVTKETVKHVARLSRIAVTDEEAERMTGELTGILDWVEQLNEIDVSDVEPMTSVVAMSMKKRADVVTDGGIPDSVVGNAPAEDDHFFMVPKVVE
ncbi:MAG: Asp-tRNA(Asn)/Glu-tRNA(Gln) amidotransferase subunit GatC [Rhodobiaceae bacterium]|nr:Asp-tRNA(Asn)/Glu-tRNA(Gln) amidotransferase subunit GatC [Rhodobiaceae bacterium]